ncbi:hypothetical protein BE221DRAFT_201186 [Ostreococcus tauri]|uniref:AD domain-containing protein n=1 Tax=Ostreococcus tauri TaxID=70448 RepID=A0A1Y5I5B0_OSTTA|nr:hypothetical protein BE221DRAFT_201186 [Ostreococcus tauri]
MPGRMTDAREGVDGASEQALKSLNPAHLKALLGQEVLVTLSDGTTRQGTVYSLDPESFTVFLAAEEGAKEHGVDIREDERVVSMDLKSSSCVVGGGGCGGNALALDALSSNGKNGWMEVHGNGLATSQEDILRAMQGSRTNSWGAKSNYAGVASMLKPSAGKQLENVKQCLRAHKVPFTERKADQGPGDVELLVLGSLVVSYPYTADDCACSNEIVLTRVRELISKSASSFAGDE